MRRTVSLVFAGLFVVGVCVSLILILPPVQRWLVLAALETPGMSRVAVGKARIRPGSAVIENLEIEKRGMRLAFDRAVVRGSLWKAVLGRNVRLESYQLDGLSLVVEAGGTSEDRLGDRLIDAAFVLAPFAFELEQVDLNGTIEVRMGPDRSLIAELVGQGAGFGVSRTGKVNLVGEASCQGLGASPVPYELTIDLRREDDSRRIESNLTGVVGGEEAFVKLTSHLAHENSVFEADGAASIDFRQLDAFLAGTEIRRLSSGLGELTFELAVNSSGESVVHGMIVASELVLAETGYRIERLRAPFRAAVARGSSLSVRAPIEIERIGLKSDLLVELTAVSDEPYWRLDGALSGDQIRIDDLAVLGVFFAVSPDPSDPVPSWGGVRGQIGLDFRRVEVQSELFMESFTAQIEFADRQVVFRDFESVLGLGSLTGDATLEFDPESEEAYGLEGSWKGRAIRVERLESIATGRAMMEGRFDIDLSFQGKASHFFLIGDRMTGNARIRGGPGVFRGLSDHARSASSVTGFLGSLFRSENLQAISELSSELSEIRYDTIEIAAVQSIANGLEVDRITMQGPEVKLYGRGRVSDLRPVELMTSPMRFEFNLGAKGNLADLLTKVGLVSDARRDWEGYAFMAEPFSVEGTPDDPDISELWVLLRAAAINAFR